MTTTTNSIIAALILTFIIAHKICQKRRYKNAYKGELYKRITKFQLLFSIISAIIFFIFLIVNLIPLGTNPTTKEYIMCIVNALTIALSAFPVSLENLYIRTFKQDEEKYSHTKTIITNIIDNEVIKKFNKADINVIVLNEKKNKYNIKMIKEEDITSKLLKSTIQIKTPNLKLLDKKIDKSNTIKEFKDLENLYNKIERARGVHDNFIRTYQYLLKVYIPIILSYLFLTLQGFPIVYNILLIAVLKLFTMLTSEYLYRKLPFANDIMTRKVKPANIIMGKQETLITIIEAFLIFFMLTIPYMSLMAQGLSTAFVHTIYISTFLFINIFLTYSSLSDSFFFIDIFKYIKVIRIHIYNIICILFVVFINYIHTFETRNITLRNEVACFVIAIITVLTTEIIKIARYSTKRGRKKRENKNNKKSRRSKSNNS